MISSGIWHKYSVNTTSDISKLLYVISRAGRRVKFETIRTDWSVIDFSSWELSFAIFRKYPVPRSDNMFVFIEYVQ